MLDNIKVNCQNSVRIEGSRVIYFDPWQFEEAPHDADVIFLTHDHYDHFSPEDIEKLRNEGTVFVAPVSIKEALEPLGIDGAKLLLVEPGQFLCMGEGRRSLCLEAIPMYNIGKQFHQREKDYVGFRVDMDGTTYYVCGDMDATPEGLAVSCDVLIVPIGGKYTMSASEAAEFTNRVKPKYAVPVHYGGIVGTPADFKRFDESVNDDIIVVEKLRFD